MRHRRTLSALFAMTLGTRTLPGVRLATSTLVEGGTLMRRPRWMSLVLVATISLGAVSTACEARVGDDGGEIEVDPGDGGGED
jgi:hypothetical protein